MRNSKCKDACPVLKLHLQNVDVLAPKNNPASPKTCGHRMDTGCIISLFSWPCNPQQGVETQELEALSVLVKPLICCVTSWQVTQTYDISSVKRSCKDKETHIILSCRTILSWAQPTHAVGDNINVSPR